MRFKEQLIVVLAAGLLFGVVLVQAVKISSLEDRVEILMDDRQRCEGWPGVER